MKSTTQFDKTSNGGVCDVVIGFDFGTSCCKVVLRTPYHFGNRAYAVPFDTASHASSKYLLPSVLWVTNKGATSLRSVPDGVHLRDIKYHLMRSESIPSTNSKSGVRYDAKSVTVAFLASALQAIRSWFFERHCELYGKYKLRWTLNIGLPSADFADVELCSTYTDIANAAWVLSVYGLEMQLTSAEAALSQGKSAENLDDDDAAEVNLIPEVAAEVVGYARSRQRNDGLHILVDIGATTFDVCGFILHEREGDDCYELLTADVRRLGASLLFNQRVSAVSASVDKHVAALIRKYDPVDAIPEGIGAYVPCQENIADLIRRYDDDHEKLCRRSFCRTFVDLMTKRDPRSDRWHSRMPVFVSGGGSEIPFYKDLISNVSRRLANEYIDFDGIQQLFLPKPEGFVADVNRTDYHRLAVAWGLSYPETDIGDVCRPGGIEDIEPRSELDWR